MFNNIIIKDVVDTTGYLSENSLSNSLLTQPDQLTPVITQLSGCYNNKFPLLMLTEGQVDGTQSKGLNTIEYTYPVQGKKKESEMVFSSNYAITDVVGTNFSTFQLVFKTKFFPKGTTVMNQFGQIARITMEPTPVAGASGYLYTLQLFTHDITEQVHPVTLMPGAVWGLFEVAAVSQSLSTGNYTNTQFPGRRKNQISILRKSYQFAGNVANKKVTEFNLTDSSGKASMYWMAYDEYQKEMDWRADKELFLWTSKYNRDANGNITMIDSETGQPIPTGAGMIQQIRNKRKYTKLTSKIIDDMTGSLYNNMCDTGKMEVTLYCGKGFMREFDDAIKGSQLFSLVAQGSTDQFIQKTMGGLMFGGYFVHYTTQDGHSIRVKELPFLNESSYATTKGVNPETGLPWSSYEAYFVDHSTYNGQRNVQMVHEEGRMHLRGIYQGMSKHAATDFVNYKGNGDYMRLATDKDASSIHFLSTCGVQLFRDTTSFALLPETGE
jgi:hypothetical protein